MQKKGKGGRENLVLAITSNLVENKKMETSQGISTLLGGGCCRAADSGPTAEGKLSSTPLRSQGASTSLYCASFEKKEYV